MASEMRGIRWAFKFSSWSPTKDQWLQAASIIQHEERERIGKFVFKKDAKSAMAGRLLIRKVVSECVGMPNSKIKLSRTDKGKPFLVNEGTGLPHFNFNVSHQGEYAVLAAEPLHAVGVDVMCVERPRGSRTVEEFFDTMKGQFTDQEWYAIREPIEEHEQLKEFYRYWCLKESYVKALGVGIGFSIKRLDFITQSNVCADGTVTDTKVCVDEKLEEGWQFAETMLDDTHCVAVGLKQLKDEPWSNVGSFKVLTFSDLVSDMPNRVSVEESYWTSFSSKKEHPARRT